MFPNTHGKFTVIPDGWQGDPELVAGAIGRCLYGQCKLDKNNGKQSLLKRHYILCHKDKDGSTKIRRPTWRYDYIPKKGVSDPNYIKSSPGLPCEICEKIVVDDLRKHWISIHLQEKSICPICEKSLQKWSMNNHMSTHTLPTKCNLCPSYHLSKTAILQHFLTNHKGIKQEVNVNWRHVTVGDYEEFRALRIERISNVRLGRESIPRLKTAMGVYEKRIRDPEDTLYLLRGRLKYKFNRFFRLSSDAIVSFNASFVSWFRADWKIPGLVFIIMEKNTSDVVYEAHDFYTDPKIPESIQPILADYAGKGKIACRGHYTSTPDFDDMMLVVETYYYTNVGPYDPIFNRFVRRILENHLRIRANKNNHPLYIWHFPVMYGKPKFLPGTKVRWPTAMGTVMVEKIIENGEPQFHISAWEMFNNSEIQLLSAATRNPFKLMERAGIPFEYKESQFASVTQDPLVHPVVPEPSASVTSIFKSIGTKTEVKVHEDSTGYRHADQPIQSKSSHPTAEQKVAVTPTQQELFTKHSVSESITPQSKYSTSRRSTDGLSTVTGINKNVPKSISHLPHGLHSSFSSIKSTQTPPADVSVAIQQPVLSDVSNCFSTPPASRKDSKPSVSSSSKRHNRFPTEADVIAAKRAKEVRQVQRKNVALKKAALGTKSIIGFLATK